MIKLLALDLDGTTLNSKGKVSEANRKAIAAAEDAGVLVTIATGRRFRDAQPVGIDLGLNAPMITHNGALVKYADSGKTVEYSLLSDATSVEIVSVGKRLGGDAMVSADPHGMGTMLYDRVSEHNRPLMKYIAWSQSLHGDAADLSIIHVPLLEDVIHDHDVVHISFSGECSAMSLLERDLNEEFGESIMILATVYEQLDFTLLDILPPDASKGHGVSRLAEIHGFLPENIMAIGDNFNDLHMLNYAGTPVVMGNADPKLHTMGEFYTTLSNDESGVAAAIERFIFNQENN
ncbi:MAG TPA: Cof-type HAD-IIB family hydrolase [Pyrinomonadaceae bacterium]|nr:HAD family phosphatase [Chloracidobacterium sp.]MBP9936882.1 HAD family phosphatase [Pyrinomonadaceae bacterium]MBK7803740.1 HAD family phosphatase [Chloracidobacterium sp.]MBK9439587.1 HAD family phosphatase [Chloracidobacterium sp.]MBL0239125.1 HAD family phosphatase [Chloracidobacterium sp.]